MDYIRKWADNPQQMLSIISYNFTSMVRPWSDLPKELLSAIANTLTSNPNTNPLDILTFRSVCRSWRSSCPCLSNSSLLSPHLPQFLSIPPFSNHHLNISSGDSYLTVTVIYVLHRPLDLPGDVFSALTPDTWILFLDEYTDGKVSFRKPFAQQSYPDPMPINFPKNINLIDFKVHELGRFYNLCWFMEENDMGGPLDRPDIWTEDVNKVVLYPNGLAAIAIFGKGRLGKVRLYAEDSKWEVIHDGKGFRFDDIVEFKGRVLGIDRTGKVYEISYDSSEIKLVVPLPPIGGGGGRRKRLVESLGLLYLVVRFNVDSLKTSGKKRVKISRLNEERKTNFKVYELNEEMNEWVEVTSIGNRSFFFGIEFAFSASDQELAISEKNCILFENGSFLSYGGEKVNYNNLYIGVCHLNDADHFGSMESYPSYSDLFWPLPPWFWRVDRLKRLGVLETAIDELLDISSENSKQLAVQEDVTKILKLKDEVITFRETETGFMYAYKRLKEAMSIHGLGQPTHMLYQLNLIVEAMDRSLEARTTRHGTEERLGCPDTDEESTFSSMMSEMLRKRNDFMFRCEERFSKLEARLMPKLTE